MYIYTAKDNDEPTTGNILAFLEVNATKISENYTQFGVQAHKRTCHPPPFCNRRTSAFLDLSEI